MNGNGNGNTMNGNGNGNHHPRALVLFAAVLASLLIVLVVAGAWLAHVNATKERNNCLRTVAVREDNRAMWAYLIEENPDDPDVPAFVRELNRRLPELRCVDNHPVPLVPEEQP
jgi:hypothetical protein